MLRVQHLTKHHLDAQGRAWPIARDLNLTVQAGHCTALLGPSGTGKSTLLKLIAGLDAAESGRIELDGQDITHQPPERRGCGMIFQDFALFPHLNVQDNVAFGLIERRVPRADARQQAQTLLARFGLAHRTHHPIHRLSGGEQQRVALARALITQPRLLLLDEPFSALDATLRTDLRQFFKAQMRQSQCPALLVTHDEAEARDVADQGFALEAGVLRPLWGPDAGPQSPASLGKP
jgi:ABC-type Fe3+/spermidine/putrescine transport system ATPase subunit